MITNNHKLRLSFSSHLKRNEQFITLLNAILVIAAWVLTSAESIYAIVPTIFILGAMYQKEQRYNRSQLGLSLKLNSDLFIHTVGAITYITLFASLVHYRLDLLIAPALAVHGALILFIKDKRIMTVKYSFTLILLGITKLALIDAANAQLWQKVALFMGIGVFILAASFWYQKLVKQPNEAPI